LTVKKKLPPGTGATIIRHVGENSTFVLSALEIEAADYAFGSNPPYAGCADFSLPMRLLSQPRSAMMR
jgi:hypothetical protein